MNENTYSSNWAARDADDWAIAKQILCEDPEDLDALETVRRLEKVYGPGFFEDGP